MKKLELKNLKVVKMTNAEKKNVVGGTLARSCHNSGCMSCNESSAWPIKCSSFAWGCN